MTLIVMKFGGTSVSSRQCWNNISAILKTNLEEGLRPVVVCSALSQASNQLNSLMTLALSRTHQPTLQALTDRYLQLARELEVDPSVLEADFQQLGRLIEGVASLQEITLRAQAQIMSFGELMLTRLGVLFLKQEGLSVGWYDVRQWLKSKSIAHETAVGHYLSSQCDSDYDPNLVKICNEAPESILLTQGFIASNERGETVLLGRGGSDVSAAYLAAKLAAKRCEIWTDVPGIYTANPQEIPQARHLRFLDYNEAQEIASMGAKVLHPKTIPPCRKSNIPLHIRFTFDRSRPGTIISRKQDESGVQIKSILTKQGIVLISIETVQMWHQVGFLADVCICFRNRGLSIDLVSTSEFSVTVSLDRAIAEKNSEAIDQVLQDLNQFARAKTMGPCASVSLVGNNIRAILYKLGSVFEVFEAQKVYLLSQAANDLNLTFVVDEDQALRLAQKLHTLLIDQNPRSQYLSRSWQEEFEPSVPRPQPWWKQKQQELLSLAEKQSPLYVYHRDTLNQSVAALQKCDAIDCLFYAVKANNFKPILRLFYEKGIHFECVSIEEIQLILSEFPKIDRKRILFTPNFASRKEYELGIELGVHLTVDNLYPLENWFSLFQHASLLIRVDPGHGAGHHKFVVTGGNASKFGIPLSQLGRVRELAAQHRFSIKGLHIHSGSGILSANSWLKTAEILLGLMVDFPDVTLFNLGGGLGVVERPGQRPLDLSALNDSLKTVKEKQPHLKIWLEPGRFLVAESGVILAKVTQLKEKGGSQFIGIETGMNSLIRPALYGSYHEIVNLTRLNEPKTIIANVVGPICESGDTLGYDRLMPVTKEGDVLLISTTGAYGHVMSSHYNQRAPASEFLLDDGEGSTE